MVKQLRQLRFIHTIHDFSFGELCVGRGKKASPWANTRPRFIKVLETGYNLDVRKRIVVTILIAACFLAVLGGLGGTLTPLSAVRAQAGSASDLIAAVNAYRSANDLAAYDVDGALMSEAQSHSEYQASIQDCTHVRADGSSPGDHGISSENIACGMNLSVDGAIYGQWTDALHSATILGPETGLVGAGMATVDGFVYYTLAVKRLSGDFTYRPPKQPEQQQATTAPGQPSSTPNPQPVISAQLFTSTPNADGSVAHRLRYGEALVQVAQAYGITLNDLYALNSSLDPTAPVYYEGQILLIRLAPTVTPSPSPTQTQPPPTRTAVPTRTPTQVISPTPTPTLTPEPLITLPDLDDLGANRRTVAYAVILVCAVGFVVVLVNGLRKGKG